ncbi:M24 family metallopeptidase [Patescibacteria group bacterium]
MNHSQIKAIRQGAPIMNRILFYIKKQLVVGITEKEVEHKLIAFTKRLGYKHMAFRPIIAFGTNSYYPHHKPAHKRLENNQIVLIDFGFKVDGWCTDLTRTFYFGQPDKKFIKLHQLVLRAQQVAINKLNSSLNGKDIDLAARRLINRQGFKKAFRHGTGHGLGKLIHQPPWLSSTRKRNVTINSGDVVTVEPGIYLKGWGGIRIEDMVLVEKSPTILSKIITKKSLLAG